MPVMSPAAWLATLERQLAAQQRDIQRYEDYYNGKHRLAFATGKFREAFGDLFRAFADNWCQIVVDSAVDRLSVEGFRFGESDADKDAWAIWQANNLDAESQIAHTEVVKCGRAYTLTSPATPSSGTPRITVEHPSQVVVAHAAGDRRERVAALKKWLDDSGYAMATLYLPDRVLKFQSQRKMRNYGSGQINWMPRPGDEGGENPLGVVPVVPLYNAPTMLQGGRSDLVAAIPLQDATNKLVTDMIVASEFAAFRQRWATGVEIPNDPDTGKPMDPEKWLSSVARVWTVGASDAHFGDFQESNLSNYVSAIEMIVQHLAAQTRTPPHYLLGKMANVSGDALKAAETGLVKRVKRKFGHLGEGWEETMRLAFRAKGDDTRAAATDAETIWADPEVKSEAELADALVKHRALGVPLEVLWARAGYSPPLIERMKQLVGLPDRPPPGATGGDIPAVLGGSTPSTPTSQQQ